MQGHNAGCGLQHEASGTRFPDVHRGHQSRNQAAKGKGKERESTQSRGLPEAAKGQRKLRFHVSFSRAQRASEMTRFTGISQPAKCL